MAEDVFQRSRIVLVYLIFASSLAVGIVLFVMGDGFFAMGTATPHGSNELAPVHRRDNFANNAVQVVVTSDDLIAAISTKRCILFVDCDWNPSPIAFRRPFSDFAAWSRKNADYKTITVKLDANSHDELWTAIQALWQTTGISPGGLKTYGGASRVVWFKDGRVVDYAWCDEVYEADQLKFRTKHAFQ